MASGIVQLTRAFGFRTGIANSLLFKDEQTVIYPCGSNLILYNLERKTQKFIPGLEKSDGMTSMCLSPNRRYVALAEKTEDGPCIVIYDLSSLKRKKLLRGTGLNTEEFISVSFSPDSMYLVAQSGEPDWLLIYWQWEKAKRLATVRTSQGNPIHQISVNPYDSTQICVTGKDIFRTYKHIEGIIKPIGLCKIQPQNFLCHTWITDEKIAVGTANGTWVYIYNGEPLEEHDISFDLPRDDQMDDKM